MTTSSGLWPRTVRRVRACQGLLLLLVTPNRLLVCTLLGSVLGFQGFLLLSTASRL
jgi:hypothetical protein